VATNKRPESTHAKEVEVSKSAFIEELVWEGDRWDMSIGEVGSADELWRGMYPAGTMAPYSVTIEEDMIQHEPRMIGHFEVARWICARAGVGPQELPSHLRPVS